MLRIALLFLFPDKPPVKELGHFLEFQLPRKWAPAFNELPLGIQWKRDGFPSLKLGWMGPKISVNTIPVMVSFTDLGSTSRQLVVIYCKNPSRTPLSVF